MKYEKIRPGTFLDRPNRFVAHVELGGTAAVCHVKNTGRCRELLVPGAKVYLEESGNPARKTQYDLIAVEKGTRLINMDAQAPNGCSRSGPGAEDSFRSCLCCVRRLHIGILDSISTGSLQQSGDLWR